MATTATKDYSKIAAGKIRRPSEVKRPLRIFIYSRNKKGKSTFCLSAGVPNIEDVLFLDPEGGTDQFTKQDPKVWPIEKWEDIDDAYKYIRSGKHNYKWIAIDGLTKIGTMAVRWVVNQEEERDLTRRPNKVSLPNYGDAAKMMEAMLFNFHNLPYGIILTSQERMVSGNEAGDEDEDAEDSAVYYVPDLQRGVRAAVNSMVDVIGRLYVVNAQVKVRNAKTQEIEEVERPQRRLWIAPHPAYDTGFRSEMGSKMPKYLKNPTVPSLLELIENGKVARNG